MTTQQTAHMPLGRCCEEVADFTGFHWFQCSRAAVVVEDDKPYCTQHRPSVVRARRDKATAAYHTKMSSRASDSRKLSAFDDLLAVAEAVVGMLPSSPGEAYAEAGDLLRAAIARSKEGI